MTIQRRPERIQLVVLAAVAASLAAAGCGSNTCTEAEAHLQECLGSDVEKEVSDDECTEDAEEAANCVLDKSCEEIVNASYTCD
jgi:hypothetical protein